MSEVKASSAAEVLPVRIRTELEKLTVSINSMMENMRKIQNPILKSRDQLPEANAQLDKVSAQTEKATHKMLDMVEQIIEHQEKMVALSGDLDEFIERSKSRNRNIYRGKIQYIKEMASTSQNNALLIMEALQFQDITAQQMHHASSLLEDVETRLQKLITVFEGKDASVLDEQEVPRKSGAFDPDADLFEGRDQKEVDSIVSQVSHTDS